MSWLTVTILSGSAVSALSFDPPITRAPLLARSPINLESNQVQQANDVKGQPLKYVDRACAESWLSWGSANIDWSSRARYTSVEPRTNVKSFVQARSSRAELSPMGVTYTACDGITRIKATAYSSKWVDYDGSTPVMTKGLGPYPKPPPSCRLSDFDCDDEWAAISQDMSSAMFRWYWNYAFTDNQNGTSADPQPSRFFGCDPPLDVCRSQNYLTRNEACHVNANHMAVLYWPPQLESRDICGNDGKGLYVSAQPKTPHKVKKPVVIKTNVITFTKEWNEAKGSFITATMTGDFTFTSPTAYVAYQSVKAMDACTQYGERKSGILPISRPIQTLARVFKDYQGSSLRMAQEIGNGTFPTTYDTELVYKPLNFADLQEPMRAGAYFEYDTNCEWPDRGCIITEGSYRPIMSVPGLLRKLNPAWDKCTMDEGVFDPPIALGLSPAAAEPTPILPEGVQIISSPTPATPAFNGMPFETRPAQVRARPLPIPPMEEMVPISDDDSSPDAIVSEDSSPPSQTVHTSIQIFDPGEGRLLELIFNAGGRPVIATYFTGSAPSLVLATATISIGGPAATVNGEALSLEPKGLVVGSKTISLQAIAPINPTDSAAVFTWDTKTVTFFKHAGDPAFMTVGTVTLSVGGAPITTEGHTVSLNTRGELVVDGTEVVDPTPTVVMKDLVSTTAGPGASLTGVAAAETAPTSRSILTASAAIQTLKGQTGGALATAEASSFLLTTAICVFLSLLYIL